MTTSSISDYEKVRLNNILKNKELLGDLALIKASTLTPSSSPIIKKPLKTKVTTPKVLTQNDPIARRRSARLANISVETEEVARDQTMVLKGVIKPVFKRARKEGALTIMDTAEDTETLEAANKFFKDVSNLKEDDGLSMYDYVMSNNDNTAIDSNLVGLRSHFQKMGIFTEASSYKTNPNRIYNVIFHPSTTKVLSCAGDRNGVLSFWDLTDYLAQGPTVNLEEKVYSFKPHSNGLVDLKYNPMDSTQLYTASHDGSIRLLDINKQVFTEIWAASSNQHYVQSIDIDHQKNNTLWFSMSTGDVGHLDTRTPLNQVSMMKRSELRNEMFVSCHDKKIGCIAVHPVHTQYLLTGSNDRMTKVFDTRKVLIHRASELSDTDNQVDERAYAQVFMHEHKFSCTSAYWAPTSLSSSTAGVAGSQTSSLVNAFVTTSYDDLLRVWRHVDIDNQHFVPRKFDVGREDILAIRHNNQTGRWVTNFRAKFHPNPALPVIIVGNMNRLIDIISAETGTAIAQLSDTGKLTAIPAAIGVHPTLDDVIVSGNASGRSVLWHSEIVSTVA